MLYNIVCYIPCALKVVDFLNDLYTTFDSVIDMFDVYKVNRRLFYLSFVFLILLAFTFVIKHWVMKLVARSALNVNLT